MATNYMELDDIPGSGNWEVTKRRKRNTGGESTYLFEGGAIDTKLTLMFDELKSIKTDTSNTQKLLSLNTEYMKSLQTKVNEVAHVTNCQSELLKTLAYKSIDIEARSKRNNLLFFGLDEDRTENCLHRVRALIYENLELDSDSMYLCRAHRIGQLRRDSARPIIVNFRDFGDVESVMSHVFKLKGSSFSIDRDLPKEIREARRRLRPLFIETKSRSPTSKVQIIYPAKLIRDRQVIRDELPDWFSVLGKSRMYDAKKIDAVASPMSRPGHHSQGFSTLTEEPIAPADNGLLFSDVARSNTHTENMSPVHNVSSLTDSVPISKDTVTVPTIFGFGSSNDPSLQQNNTLFKTPTTSHTSRAATRGNGARQRAHSTVITSRERRSISRPSTPRKPKGKVANKDVPKGAQSTTGSVSMKPVKQVHTSTATLSVNNTFISQSADNLLSQAASVVQSVPIVSSSGVGGPKQPVSTAGSQSSHQDPDDAAQPQSTPINEDTPPPQ